MGIKRQIALDTETTGKGNDVDIVDGHRIIEIGCVEIIDRKLTGREFHCYLNPERPVDDEAAKVHGMTWEMLQNQPTFRQIAANFIDFIRGSELLIHNAKFDISFLDYEFSLMAIPERIKDMATVVDTVLLAKQLYPNHQANLDALCKAFGVNASHRVQHGALLDAQLLAEVYLAMTGGQSDFNLSIDQAEAEGARWIRPNGVRLPIMGVESERHAEHLYTMVGLAQKKPITDDNGNSFCVSNWSPEINFPALTKGEEEGKKEFAKRQSDQQRLATYHMLTRDECIGLEIALNEHENAHKAWLKRVLGDHHAS